MDHNGHLESFCAEHIEHDPQSVFARCSFAENQQLAPCKEIVLKRFGVCHKHFSVYCNRMTEEGTQQLWENFNFLTSLISSMISEMPSVKKDSKSYHRKYKALRKYQFMRLLLVERVKSSPDRLSIQDSGREHLVGRDADRIGFGTSEILQTEDPSIRDLEEYVNTFLSQTGDHGIGGDD